ncbi:hypothetical protein H2201_002673 [Coniosporium apollinis]|uniref:Zn(2)-C6 fungal-type domain-containing protein n=1 Tax=Coniosporium apollinis TaxID=61459 RepID=A0ABQ9NYV8_9PEZI|nr:hypothetical protein H2201_002673 [Coniosporium apollinis]
MDSTAHSTAHFDHSARNSNTPTSSSATDLKRKRRSLSSDPHTHPASAPPPKAAKPNNHLQINYLARQYQEDLPLVSSDDTLPSIITLLGEYQGVLDRHESMACNLGARPLGPILIKRFERLFDGPPKVLKTHGKEGTTVTWLDVVEFARNKPEQFTLAQMSEGARVCQFYTKQCRVQITEEDFVLINSGIPQKMIPPQPIVEDEEKELGTLEILEKNLQQICHLADQVAARTRQLNHRLKGRKQAILDRRASDSPVAIRASSPSNIALMNGLGAPASAIQPTHSSSGGFVAVNSRAPSDQNGAAASEQAQHSTHNGNSGASSATHSELLSKFHTLADRRAASASSIPTLPPNGGELRRMSNTAMPASQSAATTPGIPSGTAKASKPGSAYTDQDYASLLQNASPDPAPNSALPGLYNPASAPFAPRPKPSHQAPPHLTHSHSHSRPSPAHEKDDGGPYKAAMVARMEGIQKGDRVLPPCDRCRRLHMDCLKNLTACMGCTKKHAKCSWKEVRDVELRAYPPGSGAGTGAGVVELPSPSSSIAAPVGMAGGPRYSAGSYGIGGGGGRESDPEHDLRNSNEGAEAEGDAHSAPSVGTPPELRDEQRARWLQQPLTPVPATSYAPPPVAQMVPEAGMVARYRELPSADVVAQLASAASAVAAAGVDMDVGEERGREAEGQGDEGVGVRT